MANYLTTREIWRRHRLAGGEAPGEEATVRPAAAALGGEEVVAALEALAPPAPAALDVARTVLFAGDCRGGGTARLGRRARTQAERFGFRLIPPAAGCASVVLRERGLAAAGDLVASVGLPEGHGGGDGFLLWPTDVAALGGLVTEGVLSTVWPAAFRLQLGGALRPGVGPVDVGLYLAAQFAAGGASGSVLEVGGATAEAMSVDGRRALAEAISLCAPRATLCAPGTPGDPAQAYFEYDFAGLVPQYAHGRAAGEFEVAALAEAENVHVDRVVIGPAASAEEMGVAARLLAGAKIHSDVQLWVGPGSRPAQFEALAQGYLTPLIDAGAAVLPSCMLPWVEELTSPGGAVAVTGLCAFEVCRTHDCEVYYVSAAGAAAAALTGELCDPTPLCRKLASE
jgi:3-isopropylmalate/(R)-2-methylmalate dehydratase large subunit